MLKLTVTVLAVVLAGTASAAGWRSMRIDASSEATFTQCVEAFKDKLSPSRRHAFERALQDILLQGARASSPSEYTRDTHFRQLDGLTYNEIVRIQDPTGLRAKRYRAEYYHAFDSRAAARAVGGGGGTAGSPWPRIERQPVSGDPDRAPRRAIP